MSTLRLLLVLAATVQVAAVFYCGTLLWKHRKAATPWSDLIGTLLSMLLWRIVITTGITPPLWFNTMIALWGSVCAVLAMYFFGREVEGRERAEHERNQLLDSERTARTAAERASRVKDDFMATLSHELRSPLAAVLGWTAILRRTNMAPDARKAVDIIERNARVQARLVDELLDATRIQSGSLQIETVPIALDGPVKLAIDAVRPDADAKQLTIAYHAPASAPVVLGDATRLQQVALNLLVNAVKFTPAGKTITVTLSAQDGRAQLVVADEGMGIAPEFMPSLFQRFRQADTGTQRRHGGLGLGLAIVSSLVALHGGEVHADSAGLGHGSTFSVILPLARASAIRRHAAAADSQDAWLDGLRVVVVDDEADVRVAVSTLLERAGATVNALTSGAQIEETLVDFQPDVVVLDISMPEEDGHALMRRIRNLPAEYGGATPAISLTAHAKDEDRRQAMEA